MRNKRAHECFIQNLSPNITRSHKHILTTTTDVNNLPTKLKLPTERLNFRTAGVKKFEKKSKDCLPKPTPIQYQIYISKISTEKRHPHGPHSQFSQNVHNVERTMISKISNLSRQHQNLVEYAFDCFVVQSDHERPHRHESF